MTARLSGKTYLCSARLIASVSGAVLFAGS